MSENKWFGRAAAFSASLLMLLTSAGCAGNNGQNTENNDSVSSSAAGMENSNEKKPELSEEQKKAAEEAGISENRYCTDNSDVTKAAEDLLKQYCDGLTEADHDKCFDAFPDFYKRSIENENKLYGETNDEYMQSLKKTMAEQYGDDFYMFASVTSVLQLSDESVTDLERRMKDAFKNDVRLDDLYYVYFDQTIRGSKSRTTDKLEFILPVINGKIYLYDSYFENPEDAEEPAADDAAGSISGETAPAVTEKKAEETAETAEVTETAGSETAAAADTEKAE
ncbi:hypothetical protein [Ruminococcus sp. HUN007]|uniref:hypothetical protein n=1 Tax=Ruminococcus sp. HUN007 TaxID=1514668 RepID=UPI0005D19237|nr:hypothetical protein [Ruminococcus sp. HUN007]